MAVIEIVGLRKTFKHWRKGGNVALDGFDMLVEAGQVHGFLGPNGSGKTTTLRTLLGLVHADSGKMHILGKPSSEYAQVAHRVGAIVESPAFFGGFSGRKTLQLLATAGGLPLAACEQALVTVGLGDRADDPVKTYSLGMKQRLAIASALLKSPELLILDEPANGLDPAGMHELRQLMRDLAGNGVTVLISSHLLDEIEQICDTVTIIASGRRIAHGPVATVIGHHEKSEYRVCVPDPARAVEVLSSAGILASVSDGDVIVEHVTDPAGITKTLGRADMWLTELSPIKADLESAFLNLTAAQSSPATTETVIEVTA